MNVLQIEAGLAGKDDLPYLDVHLGEHNIVNFEVLKPRLSRWHWWLDRTRYTAEQTIMCPILSVRVKRWGADRGKDSLPSTVVVPKHIAEMAPTYFRTILTKFTTADDVFGPVSLEELREQDR